MSLRLSLLLTLTFAAASFFLLDALGNPPPAPGPVNQGSPRPGPGGLSLAQLIALQQHPRGQLPPLDLIKEARARALAARRMTPTLAKTPHHRPKSNPVPEMVELGKKIFFDANLSNPKGMACASCHSPTAGFVFPDSKVNLALGVAPGVIKGRFTFRKAPTIAYSSYCPPGPTYDPDLATYVGGFFWDGHAPSLAAQVPFPLLNPDEMNNLVHNVRTPALVVQDIRNAAYAPLFRRVFGERVFSLPTAQIFALVAEAVAAYEEAPEVSPFTSRYDAHLLGRAALSPSELHGLRLVTGSMTGRPGGPPHKNAICSACHGIPSDPTTGPDLWSLYCYVNIGVPKNAANPYYEMTDARGNPLGYNPQGAAFIDLGLGSYLYPLNGLPSGNIGPNGNGQGDFLAVNGAFKAPTLRNVDRRPDAGFVKPYMHNGVFKSLEQVVHFYNTRNLTTEPGEVIDFTQPDPYAGLKGQPLWPPPEFPSLVTLQNPTGAIGSINAQVGNLGLTPEEEADIVAFLHTLTDGYFQR